ncbi:hypothetical protein [Acinetobacter seifertii]|uniref:hypothetical protein n=1 Tax=Acinetobacter seifertii TaxID=1530123 RepID=UPI003212E36E
MFFRLLLISFAFITVEANAIDDGDWWQQREIQLQQARDDYARRVYGRSATSFLETDPKTAQSRTITKIAIAESSPTASKVGASMFKRVAFYAKNPGVQMVGVMAVTQLIEAIGWVMEDGAYVKHKPVDPTDPTDPRLQYYYQTTAFGVTKKFSSNSEAATDICKRNAQGYGWTYISSVPYNFGSTETGIKNATCKIQRSSTEPIETFSWSYQRVPNPIYDPKAPKPPDQIIPLTPELLGAAMMGEGYQDPVNSSVDATVNIGQMRESVADAYRHSGNSVGDELADQMDDKIKNAPITPDGKPASFGDPRYKAVPNDLNTNDRSWRTDGATATGSIGSSSGTGTGSGTGSGSDTGTGSGSDTGTGTGTGSGNGSTDPQSKPQSISITFPNFCEWAFTVCKWYDDWKVTDKWMKDTPQLKDEKLEVENEDIETYHRQDSVVFGKTCPFSPERVSIPMGLVGSIDFDKDLTFFCTYGEQAAPYIQGLGYLGSLIFLMLGLRNGNA